MRRSGCDGAITAAWEAVDEQAWPASEATGAGRRFDRLRPGADRAHVDHSDLHRRRASALTAPNPTFGCGGDVWFGWGGRIRTFNLLIQSQLRYRCATPQTRARGGRATHSKERIRSSLERVGSYRSRLMTTSGLRPEPSDLTVIRIESDSPEPINRRKRPSMSVFALCRFTAQPTPKTRSLKS